MVDASLQIRHQKFLQSPSTDTSQCEGAPWEKGKCVNAVSGFCSLRLSWTSTSGSASTAPNPPEAELGAGSCWVSTEGLPLFLSYLSSTYCMAGTVLRAEAGTS